MNKGLGGSSSKEEGVSPIGGGVLQASTKNAGIQHNPLEHQAVSAEVAREIRGGQTATDGDEIAIATAANAAIGGDGTNNTDGVCTSIALDESTGHSA